MPRQPNIKTLVCLIAIFAITMALSCKPRGRQSQVRSGLPGNLQNQMGQENDDPSTFECEAPPTDVQSESDPGQNEPMALAADGNYPYARGSCSVENDRQEAEFEAVTSCYLNALKPAGAGQGYFGNIIGKPKCTNVESFVTPQVVKCMSKKIQAAGWEYRFVRFLPCVVMQTGLVSDHIYMGVCKTGEEKLPSANLCLWTDPWDGLGDFYIPGTGRNRPSHQVNLSM